MLKIFEKEASFWGIFYRSINKDLRKFLLNWYILFNIVIEFVCSITVYYLFQEFTKIIETKNINLTVIGLIFLFQINRKLLDIILFNINNEKKVDIVNRVQNYLKIRFLDGNHKFHDNYDIREKYDGLVNSIWNYDTINKTFSDIISSSIRTLTILVQLSYKDYKIAGIIIFGHLLLINIIPRISKYIESKQITTKMKELYAKCYNNIIIYEENRINPAFKSLQKENINGSMSNIISSYSTRCYYYNLESILNDITNFTVIMMIIMLLKYNNSIDGIILILFNRDYIFGLVTEYNSMLEIEKNSNKNMKELFEMIQSINNQETESVKIIDNEYDDIHLNQEDSITIKNINYEIKNTTTDKISKKITCDELSFRIKKGIILLNGRTGAGKSLTTKILAGLYDDNICEVYHNKEKIRSFNQFKNYRVIISQKIAEDYTYNGSIKMNLQNLYPNGTYREILDYLANFNLEHKIPDNFDDKFNDKLSGGERQRVAISSCLWKIFKNPNIKYLIIDEPEKGLDEPTCIKIMNYIINNFNGLVFLITHNEKVKNDFSKNILQKWDFIEEDRMTVIKAQT